MRIEVAASRTDVEKALEAHLGTDWNRTLSVSEEASPDQGSGRRFGEIPSPEIVSVIMEIGGAAASGVIGGLAYDAAKDLIAFLRRRFGAKNVSADAPK